MQIVTAGSVMDRARFFLNDQDAAVFNNTVLREPLNAAIDDLREELETNNISVTNNVSIPFSITAGITDIGGPNGPALPNDFISPINCWEKSLGVDMGYMLMQPCEFLPKFEVLTTYLQYWSWQNQMIKFLGATSDLDVKLDYIAHRIWDVINENSTINVINAKQYLAMQCAGYAAEFIGENESRANSLYGKAIASLDDLLITDIKSKQNRVVRKRPFMARFKRGGGFYPG